MLLMWQNIPSSWVERAILPLLRQQKPSYCFLSPSLFRYPSFLLCLTCFIYLLFLSLFSASLSISLFLSLSEGNDDHLQSSCPLTSGDGLRHNDESTYTHTHTHTVFTAEKTKTVEQKEETRNEVYGGVEERKEGSGSNGSNTSCYCWTAIIQNIHYSPQHRG